MVNGTAWTALGLLSIVLVIAAVTDMRTGKIFNWLTYSAMLAGLVFWLGAGFWHGGTAGALNGLRQSGLGLLAGLVPFSLLVLFGGLGGGDAKLMGAVGAITANWECVMDTAVYAFVVAAILAILIMLRHRIVMRTLQRILGAALTAVARVKPQLPQDSPRVAFGVAICIGGILAAANQLLGMKLPWTA